MSWVYSKNFHTRETIEMLADAYMGTLRKLINNCEAPVFPAYIPSDFPLARLNQPELDLLARANGQLEDIYCLSPTQQEMLHHSLVHKGQGLYFNQFNSRLDGDIDVSSFKQAWRRVMERHAVLRTSVVKDGLEEPVQIVYKDVNPPFEYLDWRNLNEIEQDERLKRFLASDRERAFELEKAPMLRLTLIRLEENSYRFIWSHHQLLIDGWSTPIVLREFFQIYEALRRGEDLQLPEPRPYKNYLAWLERQDLSDAEVFWRQRLKGFMAATSLSQRSDEVLTARRRGYGEEQILLSEAATTGLKSLARRHQLTLNTIVQGAWAAVLSHYSGEEDVVFGATASGRTVGLAEIEVAVGLFINTLPVRVNVSPDSSLLECFKELQAEQINMQKYEHVSLSRVHAWSDVPLGSPLFESVLQFENFPIDDSLRKQDGSLAIREVQTLEQLHYPVTVQAMPGIRLFLRILFDTGRYDEATIKEALHLMKMTLESIASTPDQRICDLPLFARREKNVRLQKEWSGAQTECPAIDGPVLPTTK